MGGLHEIIYGNLKEQFDDILRALDNCGASDEAALLRKAKAMLKEHRQLIKYQLRNNMIKMDRKRLEQLKEQNRLNLRRKKWEKNRLLQECVQNLCKTMVSETDDGILTNRIMHYKNSRSYQCLDFDGNLLWEEKHKAYRYTPFEERNGCVIFGTSGHGGGLYCYKISDGTCLCALDTKGTPAYCWYHDNIVCKNREGALIVMNPFENRILHEMKLDCRFTDNSGFFANERYICAVGFMKKTNSPCVCLFDMEMIN